MFILKLIYHIKAIIKLCLYKVFYRSKLQVGLDFTFRKSFELMIGKKGKVVIGDNCFFNNYCTIFANKLIIIGNGTIFGEGVKIYDHNHRFRDTSKAIKKQGYTDGEVHIGNHCWIGSNVILLKGTTIGDNCVIGSGCVINQCIPDNTIVKNNGTLIFEKIR